MHPITVPTQTANRVRRRMKRGRIDAEIGLEYKAKVSSIGYTVSELKE